MAKSFALMTQTEPSTDMVRRKPSTVRTPLANIDVEIANSWGRLRGASIRCSQLALQVDSQLYSCWPQAAVAADVFAVLSPVMRTFGACLASTLITHHGTYGHYEMDLFVGEHDSSADVRSLRVW
jgi:hypothetical protein